MKLLVAERTKGKFNEQKTAYYYKIIRLLEKNDCITINSNGIELTIFGRAISSIFIKHPKADPKFLKYAYDVEMFLL